MSTTSIPTPIRWGILGLGKIARRFAKEVRLVEGCRLEAVASRDFERTRAFAAEFAVPRSHPTYGDLAGDPDIDAVYIATIHPSHYPLARLCLEAGKSVLVEKPMAMNAKQVRDLTNLAKEKNIFLMEALWSVFLPGNRKAREWVQAGRIGEPMLIEADFCIRPVFDGESRLFSPEKGGGALLDLGVYAVSFAQHITGQAPELVQSHMVRTEAGADGHTTLLLSYAGGACARLSCSMLFKAPSNARILGTRGSIEVPQFVSARVARLLPDDGEPEAYIGDCPAGFVPEIEESCRCIRSGLVESPLWGHRMSLSVHEILDAVRARHGLTYGDL